MEKKNQNSVNKEILHTAEERKSKNLYTKQ